MNKKAEFICDKALSLYIFDFIHGHRPGAARDDVNQRDVVRVTPNVSGREAGI